MNSPAPSPESNCPRCGTALSRDELNDGGCPQCLSKTLFTPNSRWAASASSEEAIHYFGDYELLAEIASGGMGVIYKARQVTLNRTVAVKMIRAGVLASEADIHRFRTEAEAAGSLRHPHIVAIHEVGEHGGQHYFSMDYIEGQSLAELVREHPWSAERAASCVKSIAEAIYYAHERGILHRDLKPSNVMVDVFDAPHITDFGLAKRIGEDSKLTLSGAIIGTPSYMAPEQTLGRQGRVGVAGDVYSIGAILYELLTGGPPFRGETTLDTLKLVRETDPVSPRLLNPKVPRDLEIICLKCLQKQTDRRYATAAELAADLGRFLSAEPIQARPVGLCEKSWHWCRRRPALAASLFGLVLAVVGGVTGIVWQWRVAEENSTRLQIALVESELITETVKGSDRELMLAAYGTRSFQIRGRAYAVRDGMDMIVKTPLATARITGGTTGATKHLSDYVFPPFTSNGPSSPVVFAHSSPDRQRAAVVFQDGTASVLDIRRGAVTTPLLRHPMPINVAQFSPDEELVATGAADSTIRIWRWRTGRLIAELHQPEKSAVSSLRFTPSGEHLVSMNLKNLLTVWNTRTWQLHSSRTVQVSPLSIHLEPATSTNR